MQPVHSIVDAHYLTRKRQRVHFNRRRGMTWNERSECLSRRQLTHHPSSRGGEADIVQRQSLMLQDLSDMTRKNRKEIFDLSRVQALPVGG